MNNAQFLLLYDDNCPLCNWYSRLFVNAGLLEAEGRVPYQLAADNPSLQFNRDTARNQIALLDTRNGHVMYGIDSLLEIIGKRFSLVRIIGHFPPVHYLLTLLYAFISYNRKVFAPAVCNGTCDCKPDKSWSWRSVFIAVSGLITLGCTSHYFANANPLVFQSGFRIDFFLFWMQIPFQFLMFRLLKQWDFYTYAGHLAFVCMCNGLLLGVANGGMTILSATGVNLPFLHLFFYGFCGILLFLHHNKRIVKMGYSDSLTMSLLLFRVFFVPFTFQLTVI